MQDPKISEIIDSTDKITGVLVSFLEKIEARFTRMENLLHSQRDDILIIRSDVARLACKTDVCGPQNDKMNFSSGRNPEDCGGASSPSINSSDHILQKFANETHKIHESEAPHHQQAICKLELSNISPLHEIGVPAPIDNEPLLTAISILSSIPPSNEVSSNQTFVPPMYRQPHITGSAKSAGVVRKGLRRGFESWSEEEEDTAGGSEGEGVTHDSSAELCRTESGESTESTEKICGRESPRRAFRQKRLRSLLEKQGQRGSWVKYLGRNLRSADGRRQLLRDVLRVAFGIQPRNNALGIEGSRIIDPFSPFHAGVFLAYE
jgi:hypothetical protein